MCGRFVVAGERGDLLALFEIEIEGENLPEPSWNIRPTDQIPVVIDSVKGDETPVRRLASARWALTPSGSPTLATQAPLFNARAETVGEKAAFSASLQSKRAIIPATGYFEWKTEGASKRPFYVYPDEGMLGFAGLYSWWRDPAKAADDPTRWHLTATILTADAVGGLLDIHDRMPVALPQEWWDGWLDPTIEGDQDLADAAVEAAVEAAESLQMREVAPLVAEGGEELIRPL